MSAKEIIVLHETVAASIAKDIASLGGIAGVISLGVYLDSSAMQWAGFVFGTFQIMGVGRRWFADGVTTPQKAADMLRDKFGVTATPKP